MNEWKIAYFFGLLTGTGLAGVFYEIWHRARRRILRNRPGAEEEAAMTNMVGRLRRVINELRTENEKLRTALERYASRQGGGRQPIDRPPPVGIKSIDSRGTQV